MAQRHGRHGLVAACMGLAGMTVALVAHAADKTLTAGVRDALSGGGAGEGVPELRALELAVGEGDAVKVLLGYCCSASGGAVASFIGREDALMLVGTAGARDITAAGNPNVF